MASTEVQARQRNWFTGQAKKCVLCVSSCSKVICGWLKYKIAVIASGQELGLLDYRGERKCKASNALHNFTSAPLTPPAREREMMIGWEEWHEAQKEQAGEGVISSPAQPKSAWLWDSGEIEVELSVVKPNAHLSLLVTLSCFESHFTLNSSKGKEWL